MMHKTCLLTLALCWTSSALADGWESLSVAELIPRSRLIGVATLRTPGPARDGWREGKLRFSQILYSGVGQVETFEVRVAAQTVPGETQHWPGGKQGIWFVLKSGDAYEAINHPQCWLDADDAEDVCNQIYSYANELYSAALAAIEEQSSAEGEADSSDEEGSISSYGAASDAAAAARAVPHQDEASQIQSYYEQVCGLVGTTGVESLPLELGDSEALAGWASELLGVDSGLLQKLLDGDAAGLLGLQDSLADVLNGLVRNTLGAENPLESLRNMPSIPLNIPQPRGGPPGRPQNTPSFSLPNSALRGLSGSRRQMFAGLAQPGGGSGPRPGPGGPGGPGPR